MARSERILIVDDDEDASDFAGRFLSLEGYRVSRAASGREALARLARQAFDLVLLDVHMPGMDSASVLGKILSVPSAPAVLVFTGDHGSDPDIRGMVRRASGIVLKPFKLNDLRRRIRKALGSRGARSAGN